MPNILINLKIKAFYQFFVVLGSILLILSLFFDVKDYDPGMLRNKAMLLIGVGVIIWIWHDICEQGLRHMFEHRTMVRDNRYKEDQAALLFFYWLGVALVLFIAALFFFNVLRL